MPQTTLLPVLSAALLIGCSPAAIPDDTAPDADDTGTDSPALPGLARIHIAVDGGEDPDDDPYSRDWMPAGLEVIVDGEVTHTGRAGVHVRGNSSAGYDKKSYALETWDDSDAYLLHYDAPDAPEPAPPTEGEVAEHVARRVVGAPDLLEHDLAFPRDLLFVEDREAHRVHEDVEAVAPGRRRQRRAPAPG